MPVARHCVLRTPMHLVLPEFAGVHISVLILTLGPIPNKRAQVDLTELKVPSTGTRPCLLLWMQLKA